MKSLILRNIFFLSLFLSANTYAQSATDIKVVAKAVSDTAVIDSLSQNLPNMAAMPIMTFDLPSVNFGRIKTGDKPGFVYNFTNTGDKDMDILIVSACECTTLDWTKTTVKPGEKGFIKAIFNSEDIEDEDHKKPLKKTIDIILNQNHPVNNYPIVVSVDFEVFIID